MRRIVNPRPAATGPFAARALLRDWRVLCREIGERRAGSTGERRAAEYIAQRWRAAGLPCVRLETFPCTHLADSEVRVEARRRKRWSRVAAAVLVGSPGTPGGRAITGAPAWLEMPEAAHRLTRGSLRGRILCVFGPLPTTADTHRRLVAAEPAAVIHIDERLPFRWVKNDGVYPYWAKRYGMPPTLTVPYADAWRWRRDGVSELRVQVRVRARRGRSQNVIVELPGTVPELPAIVLTAHHDTQCGNPGADDNASGVVALLALGAALGDRARRRTVRLVSFGTEEQLSVGAAHHVRAGRFSLRDTALVINFDSIASPLGHLEMWVAGRPALAQFAQSALRAAGVDPVVVAGITPFADQFPFNRNGIPSLGFIRTNFSGGRWQHHSAQDTLANISPEPVSRLLCAVLPMIEVLAGGLRLPFPAGLPRDLAEHARRLGRELLG